MDWTALKTRTIRVSAPVGRHPGHVGFARVEEGHGSGLFSMDEINGFAAAGLSSDHEVKQTEEAWLKLEHGIFLELKQNNITNIVPYLCSTV